MELVTIMILAITLEALIEYGKLIFVNRTINWKQIVAIVVGVALAVLAQVDLFAIVGVTFIAPYVGMVLTGIIFSRGSNYVADFLKMVQGVASKKDQCLPDAGGDPDEEIPEWTEEQRKAWLQRDMDIFEEAGSDE